MKRRYAPPAETVTATVSKWSRGGRVEAACDALVTKGPSVPAIPGVSVVFNWSFDLGVITLREAEYPGGRY